ncbi:D-aminoacyl-tRNA deacylase [Winogradskyella maritima]|uniref:D-aminoacyl-tRNA deacylase n=1 Tax=Winogradskyella maritima TaxID=1517766 RepID=A0ABV8AIG4_9FLAO|nr:D-aminoacyl-tRNA deacylase [Winogradskyella maritima]MDO1502571.1 D-aminoacyl-tRNA deacylase [Winogradskyella maritima]
MRVVLQRVSEASVTIDSNKVANIGNGFLVLLGIENEDSQEDIDWLCKKIVGMRVFSDANGLMNENITSFNGDIIVVSQFTLHASIKKGNRPSFIKAAKPDVAIPLYKAFIQKLEIELGRPVQTGEFGADMKVALVNDGPVTISMDSKHRE